MPDKKDITTKSNTTVSPIMDDILNSAGEGIDYDTNELQIPFIRAIQALSPQIKKNDPQFIEGASQGDLFNTVTGEFWDGEKGILVISEKVISESKEDTMLSRNKVS